jgi:endonuclease/exonuclease/phosphatase family metal-dependent hydrolase
LTAQTTRFAAFNIWELTREKLDRVDPQGGEGTDPQLRLAAAIIQQVRPDVLLINEIDYDDGGENASLFVRRYLQVPQRGGEAIDYPHVFFAPVNTGVPSGFDLNKDGAADGPDDAWGFGKYPGQYGMAVLSRYPIEPDATRTFREFLWHQMPGNLMPDGREGKPAWYPEALSKRLRLSSKSHWDVALRIGQRRVRLLASHPTPPVFDGDEDRNGRRNHDEIRMWADYISGGERAEYLIDDAGRRGGIEPGVGFIIAGDLNSDPDRGERVAGRPAISQLLDHPMVRDVRPKSRGALAAKRNVPREQAAVATSDFGRLDYVLPSRDLEVNASGVFWPALDEPLADAIGDDRRSSDHRLVWIDVKL